MLRKEFEKSNINHVHDTDLTPGLTVIIKLSSLNIEFSDEVTKRLRNEVDYAYFVGKPKETCHLGENIVMLSITDKTTDHEYISKLFKVEVVDYAFDHVSRPLLSRVTSTLSGLAATVTYALVLFGQIDTTFGLVSGTTASVFALLVYRQFQSSFQKPNVVIDLGKSQL